MKEIFKILPKEIWQAIEKKQQIIEEIRIRENLPIMLRIAGKMQKTDNYIVKSEDIKQILSKAMDFSVHSYINELKSGFITIKNGHRIGVCGEVIKECGEIINFKKITSLNIRVSRAKIDFDTSILTGICDKNILIISPPNYGKTTLIREICRYLSSKNYNLSVVDERFEISLNQNLGENIDVILGACKKDGCIIMLKSMSPDYIILDEITDQTEILQEISNSGVKIVSSVHGSDINDIAKKGILQYFDCVIEIYFEQNVRKYKLKGSGDYV